jgi:hypothetical protein
VVNVKEGNPGVFSVNAIKYHGSIYDNIEKIKSLKANSAPNIETEVPLDPNTVSFGIANARQPNRFDLSVTFDVVTGTNFYNIDIINEENVQVLSFTQDSNDRLASITKQMRGVNLDPGGYFARVSSNL